MKRVIWEVSLLLTVALSIGGVCWWFLHSAAVNAAQASALNFTESGVTETVSGEGYEIKGKMLSITAAGTYRVTGACTSDCGISIGKSLTGVKLILDNLNLKATSTAPVVIKKSSDVTIKLLGNSTLTDAEPDENDSDFEGAVIKVKSGSKLALEGPGKLTVAGNAKNGIKGGAESEITINGGTYDVSALNNAIACDHILTINGGTFNIEADGDGLKAEPDEDDTVSNGDIIINDGTFNIDVDGDGIQATKSLTINNGYFDIKTLDGYNSSQCVHSDTTSDLSCKGMKGSLDEGSEVTINGGTFIMNTADDAFHSDGNMTVTGGTFTIQTGDDGMHADGNLTIGEDNGYERDPEITINNSYEGLEAGNVFIRSGHMYILSTDDGINAAGGSDGNNHDPFRPNDGDYAIWIYGGKIFINAEGDGMDSNGDITINGGEIEIWGMRARGDNEPIDKERKLIINNATVFASGGRGMEMVHSGITSTNQGYVYSTSQYSNGKYLDVKNNSGTVVYSTSTPKNVEYTFFTSPSASNSYSISEGSKLTVCAANDWSRSWTEAVTTNATVTTSGVSTFTSNCSDTERKTTFVYALGDVDGSGAVNLLDASYVARSKLSLSDEKCYELSRSGKVAADVDHNGTIDLVDALDIARSRLSPSDPNYKELGT